MSSREQRRRRASADEAHVHIVEAAAACYARRGVARTTMDDVAREAGCGRATLYRHFRTRRDLGLAVLAQETVRFLGHMEVRLGAARSLHDVVVTSFVDGAAAYEGHHLLQMMERIEPHLLLPAVAVPESPVLSALTEFLRPHVERHAGDSALARRSPRRFAAWIARAALSYTLSPSPFVDLGDEASVGRFVSRHFGAAPATSDSDTSTTTTDSTTTLEAPPR